MFDLGFAELVTFAMIALVVLGPEKLPRAMRTLGTYYAKFRRTISTIQAEMESELDLAETRQKMQQELAKIKQAELDMQNQMAQMRQNMRQFEENQDKQLAGNPNTTDTVDVQNQDNLDSMNSQPTTNITIKHDVNLDKTVQDSHSKDINQQDINKSTPSDSSNINSSDSTNSVNENAINELESLENLENKLFNARLQNTRPWENRWFRLGAYDKARRLPAPPRLPDYSADKLLNTSVPLTNQTTKKVL